MGFKQIFLQMINAAGGRSDMADALGITLSALDNRVHEKGSPPQRVHLDMAIQMQLVSDTTLFAEEVARQSGGMFIPLPQAEDQLDNEQIQDKFLRIVERVGELATCHRKATEDGRVDQNERADLDGIAHEIHRSVQEMLALTYMIYSAPEPTKASVPSIADRKAS
ncbi:MULTISPECIES: YmfL family putative regulatory protein [unclassified Caballeronia]|uniref:YmfL family putative regulatory protein n=1 Tax=unclassified Caballeronia TaxID=2646786 RepID=UPI002862AE99|nr:MULTISPECIES: YmfL family putative regulatory protein [unclassified Caballeronia]MDR5776257.1 YmfL family putative regulatory protein [Caballeronia sp. LZ002]MDR5851697.1 YmfL family putative regulatory protein [Caballeronia sp. LZ003]